MNLKEIGRALLNKKEDYAELTQAINAYRQLMQEITELNTEDEKNRSNLHLDTGLAIGTTWAAMCLDDIMRTKQFVSGLFKAVEHVLKEQEHVHILYAGTGPYATLLLPVLAAYSPEQVQATLLEINETSIEHVRKVIGALGFNEHIVAIQQADATTYRVPESPKIDIVLTETMQRSLAKEQQVPIVINLLSQLDEGVILIPEKIQLHVGGYHFSNGMENGATYKKAGKLFELSKETVASHSSNFPKKTVALNPTDLAGYPNLALFTEIRVFGEVWIRVNESGLTVPEYIGDVNQDVGKNRTITSRYVMGANPHLEFELN